MGADAVHTGRLGVEATHRGLAADCAGAGHGLKELRSFGIRPPGEGCRLCFVVEKRGPGFRVAILGSASGLAYLAFCAKEQRETTLDLLARSRRDEDKGAKNRKKVYEILADIRKRGHAVWHRPRRVSDETSISVPVMSGERLLATLTIRFSSTAVQEAEATQRFVPKLHAVAQRIGAEFGAQSTQDAEATAAVGSGATARA